jgi:hypothetical protein
VGYIVRIPALRQHANRNNAPNVLAGLTGLAYRSDNLAEFLGKVFLALPWIAAFGLGQ